MDTRQNHSGMTEEVLLVVRGLIPSVFQSFLSALHSILSFHQAYNLAAVPLLSY